MTVKEFIDLLGNLDPNSQCPSTLTVESLVKEARLTKERTTQYTVDHNFLCTRDHMGPCGNNCDCTMCNELWEKHFGAAPLKDCTCEYCQRN